MCLTPHNLARPPCKQVYFGGRKLNSTKTLWPQLDEFRVKFDKGSFFFGGGVWQVQTNAVHVKTMR